MRETILNTMRILTSRHSSKEIALRWLNGVNLQEYRHPPFAEFNERPVEYRFVFEQIASYYPKTVLDVGTGRTALPHVVANCGCHATAIDNIHEYWPRGLQNRHYYVINDDIVNSKLSDRFDMVTCVSTLEHIDRYDEAIKSMFRLLKDGGYLVLTFPYNEEQHIENLYLLPGSSFEGRAMPYKACAFSRADLERWQRNNHARIVKQELWRFFDGEYWRVGKWVLPPVQVDQFQKPQLTCLLLEKVNDGNSGRVKT
jgi:SAM-dependent methyltransferase